MKKVALVFAALCLMSIDIQTAQTLQNNTRSEEPKMTLEQFNDPKNFLATRPTFDIAAFNKNKTWNGEYRFVRKDGVHVFQHDEGDEGYQEELTRPDSHYEYGSIYNRNGRLKGMWTRFCNYGVGIGLWLDKAGNIVKSKNFDENFLPVEKLRTYFLEQSSGIDIYDVASVRNVFYIEDEDDEDRIYFNILVIKTPNSGEFTGYLLDGSSGKILYKANSFQTPAGYLPSTYNEYKKSLKNREK